MIRGTTFIPINLCTLNWRLKIITALHRLLLLLFHKSSSWATSVCSYLKSLSATGFSLLKQISNVLLPIIAISIILLFTIVQKKVFFRQSFLTYFYILYNSQLTCYPFTFFSYATYNNLYNSNAHI